MSTFRERWRQTALSKRTLVSLTRLSADIETEIAELLRDQWFAAAYLLHAKTSTACACVACRAARRTLGPFLERKTLVLATIESRAKGVARKRTKAENERRGIEGRIA